MAEKYEHLLLFSCYFYNLLRLSSINVVISVHVNFEKFIYQICETSNIESRHQILEYKVYKLTLVLFLTNTIMHYNFFY